MFVLATVYKLPGHHTDFTKSFSNFISALVLAQDKVLIVGDFNIHVNNEKDALGSAFIDILNSIGVRQHVSGPTRCLNHTLDLILSRFVFGACCFCISCWVVTDNMCFFKHPSIQSEKITSVNGIEILQQNDDISDNYLVSYSLSSLVLHTAKTVKSTSCYMQYGRIITSTTKDCFVNNHHDLSKFPCIYNCQVGDGVEDSNAEI